MLKRRKPIKRVSDKRRREYPLYMAAREKFLQEHPTCQVCMANKATEIHHKKRRRSNYLNVDTFLAICRPCHLFVESNPKWAEEHGYLDRTR